MNFLSLNPFISPYSNLFLDNLFNPKYQSISPLDINKICFNNIFKGGAYLLNEEIKPYNFLNIKDPFPYEISNVKEKRKIFEVIYPNNESEYESLFNDNNFRINTRYKLKRKRFENQDNIRKKIKRAFLNVFLYNKLNLILKKGGSRLFFEKFPQNFVADISRNNNIEIVNMTLKSIFQKKELYLGIKAQKNFYHNLKVLNLLKEERNLKLEYVLDKKYCDLFFEYINSDEFKINEINRLKKKNMSNSYIMRYIYLSKHFIEFFSKI